VEGIIAAGRHLQEAKDKLEPGDFLKMIEADLPFGESTAERLMKIAKHPVLSNSAHAPLLPTSWSTLYELTKLPAKKLEAKLIDGTITADLERKDIAKLMPPKKCAAVGCNKPVHKDGYCDQHYEPPEPLSAHDQIIPVLERFKNELRTDPDQTRKLVDWLVGNVEEGQREALFKPLADLLPIDQEAAGDSSSNQEEADGTIIIQLPASPEPPPEALFENPEDEPSPPLAPVGQHRDDEATPPGEMPPMPEFLERRQEQQEADDPEPVFEEDADAADRSSGRPEDEWEGSSTRWD
jgi:DUF3102 family protein